MGFTNVKMGVWWEEVISEQSKRIYTLLEQNYSYFMINLLTATAALRPSLIAHTTSDWPRLISPAVKIPFWLVI